jgi:DinB superfamily
MTTLQSTDVEQALEYFDRTRKHVVSVTTGLSDAQWNFKPALDCWSIAEVLEHMVIVQELVLETRLKQLAQAPAAPPERDYRVVDQIIFEKFPGRSLKAKAPDFSLPTGECPPQAALDRLSRNYQGLAAFVESTDDMREHLLDAPPLRFVTNGAYETMDGYQWALTVAAHDERHVRQILEIQAAPDYPRHSDLFERKAAV